MVEEINSVMPILSIRGLSCTTHWQMMVFYLLFITVLLNAAQTKLSGQCQQRSVYCLKFSVELPHQPTVDGDALFRSVSCSSSSL